MSALLEGALRGEELGAQAPALGLEDEKDFLGTAMENNATVSGLGNETQLQHDYNPSCFWT